MSAILVTGGAGFIGGTFLRQWLACESGVVVNLDKLTYAADPSFVTSIANRERHVFVQNDISDRECVRSLLSTYRPQAVIHFAAESHVDRSIDGPEEFISTNVVGTYRLLEAVREYWRTLVGAESAEFRFLHISTDEVYGSLGADGAFTESAPYAPNSPYAASKASADHFVRAYHRTYGLPVLISHCSNNYGPFQLPEKLIPFMILNAIEDKPLPVYGDGCNVRDWIYVDEHCEALRTILARGKIGEVYNIGGNCEQTNLTIVKMICAILDEMLQDLRHKPCESLITLVQDRPGHDRRYAVDGSKMLNELGWRPNVGLLDGLRRTVAWYLKNMSWVERVRSGGYPEQRLGLGL